MTPSNDLAATVTKNTKECVQRRVRLTAGMQSTSTLDQRDSHQGGSYRLRPTRQRRSVRWRTLHWKLTLPPQHSVTAGKWLPTSQGLTLTDDSHCARSTQMSVAAASGTGQIQQISDATARNCPPGCAQLRLRLRVQGSRRRHWQVRFVEHLTGIRHACAWTRYAIRGDDHRFH